MYAPEYVKKRDTESQDEIAGTHPKKVQTPPFKKKIPVAAPKKPEVKATPKQEPVKPTTTVKKEITNVYFKDSKGNKIEKGAYGTTIRAYIISTGLKNHQVKVKVKVYDKEIFGSNHFLTETPIFAIPSDKCFVNIFLTKDVQEKGGNMWYDELFVDIEILETKAHVLSKIINIDTKSFKVDIPDNETKGKVGNTPSNKPKTCSCKLSKLIWGAKVSCEFLRKVEEISTRQKIDPNNLMAAMAHETGGTFDPSCGSFKSHKDESREGYVGLIQIGKDAASDIGISRTKLLAMSQLKQLDYVEKYLERPMVKGKLNTLVDFYLAVLFPVDCGKGDEPNHIVFDNSLAISYKANGKPIKNLNYWRNAGYSANKPFLKEGKNENGKTYIWEIAENIQKWYDNGINNKQKVLKCNYNFLYNSPVKDSNWHEPVDNPMLCLYTQNGNYRPRYNVFGKVRAERSNHNHQGVDLLALPGSNIYACTDAEIVYVSHQSGYGNVICLKVKDTKALLKKKRDFSLTYEKGGEILQGDNFNFDGDIYLFYAHLQASFVTAGDKEVKCGDVIGINGTSGFGTTKDPHLHFEIRNKSSAKGLNNRCNPGYFVNYKTEASMSQDEKKYQEDISKINWD